MNDITEIQQALAAGRSLGLIQNGHPNGFIIIPTGYRAESVEQFMPTPARTKLKVALNDLTSFIRYLQDNKTEATRIFATVSEQGAAFGAVIDCDTKTAPSWRDHKAGYTCELTPEWKRWVAGSKQPFNQVAFAEFLEANQLMIVDPPGAELLEMIQTLEGKNNVQFKSVKRLTNGKQSLDYQEDIELSGNAGTQKGKIEMPAMLTLGLAPFVGGTSYKVSARLKYRITGTAITFQYELVDPHLIIRDAVKEMIELLTKETGIAPLMGSLA